jgi:hypothetical protein
MTMRFMLACLCAMSLVGCDANVDPEKEEKEPPVQPEVPVTPIPVDTTSRRVSTEDTLAQTSTTVTLVRKELLIRGKDTTVLAIDTVRLLNGKFLVDTALSVLPPCTNAATFYNAYGSSVVLELWTGNTITYKDGRVFGTDLKKRSSAVVLADSAHNRLCQDWIAGHDVLVVAGVVDSDGSTYPLGHGQFLLNASSILVVDEEGLVRPLH